MKQQYIPFSHSLIFFSFFIGSCFLSNLNAQTYPCDEYKDPDRTGSYALPDGFTWCEANDLTRREGRSVSAYAECMCREQKKSAAKQQAKKQQREADIKAAAEKSKRKDAYYERKGNLHREMTGNFQNKNYDAAISIAEQIISLVNSNKDLFAPETIQSTIKGYQSEIATFERERDTKNYQLVGSSTNTSYSPSGSQNSQNRNPKNTAQDQAEEFKQNHLENQKTAIQRQNEANERQQKKWYNDFQAQLEQNRIDRQNLDAAGSVAAQQVAEGNYQQAGMTYGMELANQGNAEAALVSMGVGTGLQIWSELSKEKKKKKEAEARELEEQRILRERERKRAELLRRQKRQFEEMVAAQRAAKKNIVAARTNFFTEKIPYTKTFDKFSRAGEPIYIFFVEAGNDYKDYKERVSFPDQVNIQIKEKVNLNFSPIMKIYPNSGGEYPFLKEILEKIETEFVQKSGTTYKIYDWSPTLEEAQKNYKTISEKAIAANFIPAFPKQILADFNEGSSANDLYWGDDSNEAGSTSKAEEALDYWNLSKTADSLNVSKVEKEKTDYWKVTAKKDSLKVQKPKVEEIDYWNQENR